MCVFRNHLAKPAVEGQRQDSGMILKEYFWNEKIATIQGKVQDIDQDNNKIMTRNSQTFRNGTSRAEEIVQHVGECKGSEVKGVFLHKTMIIGMDRTPHTREAICIKLWSSI